MCGIAGIISEYNVQKHVAALQAMSENMIHRGPDHGEIYIDQHAALAHRRLSIIDLSAAAHQPMRSADGRYVLICNGEIYNFGDLKVQLGGYPFMSRTDSEVILAAFARWGTDCFTMFNGMFAFALWDTQQQELYLVRDPAGIKPVYYICSGAEFIFASEIRTLLANGLTPRKLDFNGVLDYFQYQTVHAPCTIIENVRMLEAGHYLRIRVAGGCRIEDVTYMRYMDDIQPAVAKAKSYHEVKSDVYRLMTESVARRMVADVPLGVFLSGGIDSSAIVGLMSRITGQAVNTFNVDFDEQNYSEAKYARIVAKKFNTNHNEIKLRPKDFLAGLPEALAAIDHPSGDGPNTWIVSREVQKGGIKVAFSGLGGDELFAGYLHFHRAMIYSRYASLAKIPKSLKHPAAYIYKMLRPSVGANKMMEVFEKSSWDLPYSYPVGRRMFLDSELSSILTMDTKHDRVADICSGIGRYPGYVLSRITLAEFSTYMQHVLLRDTDQMTMAVSIEGRLPFLDHELVKYVLNLPDAMKRPVNPKQLLVDAMGDMLPSEIVNRPKMGFFLPWDVWIHHDLREFCASYLLKLGERDFVKPNSITSLWMRYLKGDKTISWSRLWYLVVLEHWLEQQGIQ